MLYLFNFLSFLSQMARIYYLLHFISKLFFHLAIVVNKQGSLHIFFIVLTCIEANFFFFYTNAKGQNEIDEFENKKRNSEAVGNCNYHCLSLCQEKADITQK